MEYKAVGNIIKRRLKNMYILSLYVSTKFDSLMRDNLAWICIEKQAPDNYAYGISGVSPNLHSSIF